MTRTILIVSGLGALLHASVWAGVQTPTSDQSTAVAQTTVDDTRHACKEIMPRYLKALAANPEDAKMHNRVGVCYQHLGQNNEAVREYQNAIKLDPRQADAWNNLGSLYHARRDYKRAVKHYRKAIEARPEMAVAHRNLGTALLAQGKIKDGYDAYVVAYAIDPMVFEKNAGLVIDYTGNAAANQYYFFAKLSARNGRIETALDFLDRARLAGYRDFDAVKQDADFKDVVHHERFALLVR
jgi:tetratricopeptide (TPR) repeat protein